VGCFQSAAELGRLQCFVARSCEERLVWVGAEKIRRVFFAAMMLLATLGTVSWSFRLDVARGFVIVAVSLVASLALTHRDMQRKRLRRARGRQEHLQITLFGRSSLRCGRARRATRPRGIPRLSGRRLWSAHAPEDRGGEEPDGAKVS
jgi:hypothetical protein